MQISIILAQQVAELFLVLLIGCALVKTRLLKSADSRVLSVIMVYAVMPCVIINAFQVDYSPAVVTGLLYAFVLAAALHALLLLIARLLRRPLRLDVIERTCVVYTNAGILVIPLVRALLGEGYVIYSCAFIVVQQILLWTHCRSLLCGTRGFEWKKIIGNVNIIAILIGGALFVFRLPLPSLVGDLFSQLGAMVGSLGMLLAGMVIAESSLRALFTRWRHYVPVVLRLLVCPLITAVLLRVIGAADWIPDGHSILLTVYLACITPACATVTSMAQLYDCDAEHASALYVLTTLLSIVTMPLMVWVFEALI